MNWKTNKNVEFYVSGVDFQFEDSKYKLVTVSVCYNTISKTYIQQIRLHEIVLNIFTIKFETM